MKHTTRTNLSLLAVAITALLLLVGCTAQPGSSDQVRLVITPIPTPTYTPVVPPTPQPTTYTVKPGDTLSGIASLFGVTVDDIVRVNSITDPNVLSDGQVLKIPARSAATDSTPTEQGVEAGTQTPQVPVGSPTLPPANLTPPLGPTTSVPTPGGSSSPGTTISPTAAP